MSIMSTVGVREGHLRVTPTFMCMDEVFPNTLCLEIGMCISIQPHTGNAVFLEFITLLYLTLLLSYLTVLSGEESLIDSWFFMA